METSVKDRSSVLSRYFSEIREYPLLTKDEEMALADGVKRGDRASLNELIESNLSFVVKVSSEYRNLGLPFRHGRANQKTMGNAWRSTFTFGTHTHRRFWGDGTRGGATASDLVLATPARESIANPGGEHCRARRVALCLRFAESPRDGSKSFERVPHGTVSISDFDFRHRGFTDHGPRHPALQTRS